MFQRSIIDGCLLASKQAVWLFSVARSLHIEINLIWLLQYWVSVRVKSSLKNLISSIGNCRVVASTQEKQHGDHKMAAALLTISKWSGCAVGNSYPLSLGLRQFCQQIF